MGASGVVLWVGESARTQAPLRPEVAPLRSLSRVPAAKLMRGFRRARFFLPSHDFLLTGSSQRIIPSLGEFFLPTTRLPALEAIEMAAAKRCSFRGYHPEPCPGTASKNLTEVVRPHPLTHENLLVFYSCLGRPPAERIRRKRPAGTLRRDGAIVAIVVALNRSGISFS
jgi:hypothetical protein